MPVDMRIHLHCLCWNEARLLPHFFRCYDRWVDEYHVWDNGSIDGSLNLLLEHPRVNVYNYQIDGDSVIEAELRMFDRIWQDSRGLADWVILVNIDEHLHHSDLVGYLNSCMAEGVTALRGVAYEMVADGLPSTSEIAPLEEHITQGVRTSALDRLCIFQPKALTSTNFLASPHLGLPQGDVVWPLSPELLLLKFRLLGDDFFIERAAELAGGFRAGDSGHVLASALQQRPDKLLEHATALRSRALAVPGLGELADLAPKPWRGDEKLIDESGLLDYDWYLSAYPDVAGAELDPLNHFCFHGWQEGRKPNPYFDTQWYASRQANEIKAGQNPLVHYIERGERENARPSLDFDPAWYRSQHALALEESPLHHYLMHRHQGKLSPVPQFKPTDYLDLHPELAGFPQDLYLHSVQTGSGVTAAPPAEAIPDLAAVLALAGGDLHAGVWPTAVRWTDLSDVLRLFLPWLPFNETWYLETYPDVADAVRDGMISTAHFHFIQHGFFEARRPTPPASNS